MKIGMFSTFGEQCGVSEYTKSLIDGLQEKGITAKIVGNYPKSDYYKESNYNIKRLFGTPFLTNCCTAEIPEILNFIEDCDICHFQMETSIYHTNYIFDLVNKLKELNKLIVFTMHSGGIWHQFPISRVDHFITHDHPFASEKSTVIPMGVKLYNDNEALPKFNTMVSFGLGRNNDDYVNEAIAGMNIDYSMVYGHRGHWLPLDDLINKIRESWIISLLYPEIGSTSVSSSAVMLAMGCDRPILVSNTNWFSHIINFPNIYVCDNISDVKTHVKYLTDKRMLPTILQEITEMKKKLIDDKRTFDDFINNHIILYNKMLNS